MCSKCLTDSVEGKKKEKQNDWVCGLTKKENAHNYYWRDGGAFLKSKGKQSLMVQKIIWICIS